MAVRSINQSRVNLSTLKRLSSQYILKVFIVLSTTILMTNLVGCHSFAALKTRPVWMMPNLNIQPEDQSGIASVHCSGGVGCQFISLNNVVLLTEQGEPTEHGKTDAILRFESAATSYSSQYYLALTAAQMDLRLFDQGYPARIIRKQCEASQPVMLK